MGTRTAMAGAMLAVAALTMGSQAVTVTFQNGANGYNGCSDAELRVRDSNYNNKVAPSQNVMLCITG